MKIKFTALSFLLLALWASAEESPQVSNQKSGEARILERPYQGIMVPGFNSSGPTDRREIPIVLNYYLPPGKATGRSPNTVPYLATTKDGKEYWNTHAYRSSLPSQDELAALKTYKDFFRVLGPPIDPPSGLKTQGGWFYDTVVWRLFTPADGLNVLIMHVSLRRKWDATQDNGEDNQDDGDASQDNGDANRGSPVYLIESISILGGAFQPGVTAGPSFVASEMLSRSPFIGSGLLGSSPSVSPVVSPP